MMAEGQIWRAARERESERESQGVGSEEWGTNQDYERSRKEERPLSRASRHFNFCHEFQDMLLFCLLRLQNVFFCMFFRLKFQIKVWFVTWSPASPLISRSSWRETDSVGYTQIELLLVDLFWFPFTSTEQTARQPNCSWGSGDDLSLWSGEAKVQSSPEWFGLFRSTKIWFERMLDENKSVSQRERELKKQL